MLYRERTHFSPANCNNQLITVIEKGREVLDRIPFEKLPPRETRSLLEVLHELYSDGAGI